MTLNARINVLVHFCINTIKESYVFLEVTKGGYSP